MTEEDIKSLVRTAAKEAAVEAQKELFLLMGVKLDDSDDILNMQKNFQHLQESREGKEEFVKKGKSAVMVVFITGVIALVAKGFWADMQAFILKVVGGAS